MDQCASMLIALITVALIFGQAGKNQFYIHFFLSSSLWICDIETELKIKTKDVWKCKNPLEYQGE